MIRYKGYAIDADSVCYTIGKLATVKDKKTGEDKERIIKPNYCSSLSQAVSIMAEMLRRECVANNDMQLEELVMKLEEIDDGIKAAIDFK